MERLGNNIQQSLSRGHTGTVAFGDFLSTTVWAEMFSYWVNQAHKREFVPSEDEDLESEAAPNV